MIDIFVTILVVAVVFAASVLIARRLVPGAPPPVRAEPAPLPVIAPRDLSPLYTRRSAN